MQLNSGSKFYQISKKLAQRDQKKFMAVDEQDRDEIFQDYLDELFQKEQDEEAEARLKRAGVARGGAAAALE